MQFLSLTLSLARIGTLSLLEWSNEASDLVLNRRSAWERRVGLIHGNAEMKFYISTKGIRRVTISNGDGKGSAKTTTAGTGAGSARRISVRTVFPVVLVLGIVLPFLFVRIAILMLESAAACSSLGNLFPRLFTFFFCFFLLLTLTVSHSLPHSSYFWYFS